MRILVVDDDASVREVSARALRADGHEVSTADDGAQALSRLAEPWDIILTDLSMPGEVDGLELLRRVKETASADVILTTGFAELNVAIQAIKLGAYDFITKPSTVETLQAAVRRCAAKRELSAELSRERALRSELERMQRVKETFGHFVTPEVVNFVLSLPEDGRKNSARRKVTVLFADVRRFTAFAESIPPEEAVETLNEMFSGIVSAVQAEGGILNKFLGDGVLALFGAPLDLEGQERAAARAALASMTAARKLADARRSRGLTPLDLGIAVNTGMVVAGCLGTQDRTEYSVIGHAVNLAARLNAAAKPGQILLGPGTVSGLGVGFSVVERGPMNLAGVTEAIPVCELLGAMG